MSNTTRRVFNFALADFYRNKGVAIAAIFVLALTTLLVTFLFFVGGISNYLVNTIEDKIDITAYFKEDADEQDILSMKEAILLESPHVKKIEYVSKEDALDMFLERHKDSAGITDAINEIGTNPFLPSLNIVTQDPSYYQEVATILASPQFNSIIESVDFSEKRATIEKIFQVTRFITWGGVVAGVLMVLVAIVVVFNTMKLIIDRSKDEIGTMKIVGASDWFVKGPFIIEGGIFGFIASLFAFVITAIVAFSLSFFLSVMMPGFSLFGYFLSNFFIIILIQLVCGVGLGVLASFIVVRKYLNV